MKLINGDCLEELDKLEKDYIDCIITDPPYELNFMGKGWDNAGVSFNKNTWEKCLRVLKPGGYLLAFGGTRTYHRIACAIEDAGFEIRDTIMWLYGSGFPKGMNISKGIEAKKKYGKSNTVAKRQIEQDGNGKEYKVIQTNNGAMGEKKVFIRKEYTPIDDNAIQWKGWSTSLKPSFEPIIVARKPFKGSCIDNIIKYGVGGLNIDECRVSTSDDDLNKLNKEWDREWNTTYSTYAEKIGGKSGFGYKYERVKDKGLTGRFPANTILDTQEGEDWRRYFYCAKASKKDRDEGLEEYNDVSGGTYCFRQDGSLDGKIPIKKNIHPTVKPTELMQYLVRLVSPKGAIILDPFMGSGSTGKAVMYENKERDCNYDFIGIELDKEYYKIAEARINYIKEKK